MAGPRSEGSASGALRAALIRLALRCCVVAGLLVGGWYLGGSTAVAGPLESESGSTGPLGSLGSIVEDVPDDGTIADESGLVDTDIVGTDVVDTDIGLVDAAGGIVGDTGLAEPVLGVVRGDAPDPGHGIPDDVPLPASLDPPAVGAAAAPEATAPAAPPVAGPDLLLSVSGPVAPVTEPAVERRTAPQAADIASIPQPAGGVSAPPCSTGGSTGSGAANGPAVTTEALAAPHPASLRRAPATTGTTRPCGLPRRPSASPD